MISVIVLGAGAGGGFPQWNSNAAPCRRARAGDPSARSCTQTSIAVSGDGEHWLVLNAAPDLRAQIEQTHELHPKAGLRSTPIVGVALAGSEIDAVVGLLTLRESQAFSIYATPTVLAQLDENPIFSVLSRELVTRVPLSIDVPQPLQAADGLSWGLTLTPFSVPGKIPLYKERAGACGSFPTDGTVGFDICDGKRHVLFVPGCASVDDGLRRRMANADCLFFDGTLWTDDEMARAGISNRTGKDMGHMAISGPDGVIAQLASVPLGRRILIHINNSNPVLLSDAPERAILRDAGWEVGYDGMRFTL